MEFLFSYLSGYIVGVGIAFLGALFLAMNKGSREKIKPFINLVSIVPIIIYLPFVYIWFRLESESLFWLTLFSSLVPMFINSMRGFLRINDFFYKSADNLGADKYLLMSKVLVPGSMAAIFRGLRISWALSLVGLVVYQLLGYVTEFSSNENYSKAIGDQKILLTIFMVIAAGLIVDTVFLVIRKYLLVWDEEVVS